MSELTLVKLHGLGNDFLLVESEALHTQTSGAVIEAAVRLCDRRRGLGADGVILWSRTPDEAGVDARMVIYNQDGSRPEMCGNGIRCLAALLHDQTGQERWAIDTDAGVRLCVVTREGMGLWQVRVDMGRGRWDVIDAPVPVADQEERWFRVDMGNPHGVVFATPARDDAPDMERIDAIGASLNTPAQHHPAFPAGVNVEFVEQLAPTHLRVIVFERGVGRTEACGTGACAVAVAAWASGHVAEGAPVTVELPGGPLRIERGDAEDPTQPQIWMTGPAERVATARLHEGWASRWLGEHAV